ENVNWKMVQEFIRRLNEKNKAVRNTGYAFKLPTEAQWEYAARVRGKKIKYPWGNEDPVCEKGVKNGTQYAGCKGNTVEIGQFGANDTDSDLYDMTGNVYDWCMDCYDEGFYKTLKDGTKAPVNDKFPNCARRVIRGGSWGSNPRGIRAANRVWVYTTNRYFDVGFRLVRVSSP
ncbi:MAG: formylglycine-generating enzyme family protein, partial [bacterium]|nr:formylglycine-generating enzyme family protein [bacterium]